jgi:hypothetical protein
MRGDEANAVEPVADRAEIAREDRIAPPTLLALAMAGAIGWACGGDGTVASGCVEGTQVACMCVGGASGVQVCTPESVFGPCDCGQTGTSTATGTMGETEDSETGSTSDSGSTTDPSSTTAMSTSTTAGASASSTGNVNCEVFVGLTPDSGAVWTSGAVTGFDAGTALCQGLGAEHVCDYEELLVAEGKGELASLTMGQTVWVHRTTSAMVDDELSPPGTGGRCVNWTSAADDFADGEFFEVTGDGIVFHLDPDTFYDGIDTTHADPASLPCAAVTRAIACCNTCE